MFEKLKIRIFGHQPTPNITDKILERVIQNDYPKDFADVKTKLELINSDSRMGKNRFAAAILRLADRDSTKIDSLVEMCNNDFRDVLMQAEYPRVFKDDSDEIDQADKREIYLADWTEYSNWLKKY